MAVDTSNNGLRVPFGLRQGRLYPPQGTDRGLACECVCPGCGSALIANQGERKRPYFSHYQSRECAGGYESAVHLMAKQIIDDRRYIVIPEFRQIMRRKMPTGDVLSEEVVVPGHRLDFSDVHVEQTVDGLRPDVIGVTSDGTEILIEVYVTHAVTDDKRERLAKKNLIELNLSVLPQDLVADDKLFAEEVLSGAGREWISCQLYREEIKIAHQALQEKVKRFITDHRVRAEQAKTELRQRRLAEKAAEKKKVEIEARKSQLREQYSRHLEQLQTQTFDQERQERGQDNGTLQAIAPRLQCSELPAALAHEQNGDWIFRVHRTVWQAFIYERFIQGNPRNSLRANDVKRAVVREFGLVEWIAELISLKHQHKVQGCRRGQWYGKKGVWFFTDAENRMIPSPYLLVLNHLKRLAHEGLLTLEHRGGDSFTVKFDSFAALEGYKAEQSERARLVELDREKAVIEVRKPFQPEWLRLAEIERRQKYTEDNEKRIKHLVALVNSLFVKKGVRDVKRCNNCSHFQELNDGDACVECNCLKLWDIELTSSYLETLPHRLRCLRLFPPTEARFKAC